MTSLNKILYSELNAGTSSPLLKIYASLFSLLGKKQTEENLKYIYNIWSGKDGTYGVDGRINWFAIFHKSIRQTDFFEGHYQESQLKLLTSAQEKRYRLLIYKVCKEGYIKDSTEEGELFTPEYNEYLELAEKKRHEKRKKPISGYLDNIFWNTIHADKKEELYGLLITVFEKYQRLSKRKKNGKVEKD